MEEEWRQSEHIYEVSSHGHVRNSKTGKILKSGTDENGNRIVYLYINGKQQKRRVSRLVAETFNVNDISNSYVKQHDSDKDNNNPLNLEIVPKYSGKHIRIKETGDIYQSISDCSRETGMNRSTISRCLNYPFYGNSKGYHFESIDQ